MRYRQKEKNKTDKSTCSWFLILISIIILILILGQSYLVAFAFLLPLVLQSSRNVRFQRYDQNAKFHTIDAPENLGGWVYIFFQASCSSSRAFSPVSKPPLHYIECEPRAFLYCSIPRPQRSASTIPAFDLPFDFKIIPGLRSIPLPSVPRLIVAGFDRY